MRSKAITFGNIALCLLGSILFASSALAANSIGEPGRVEGKKTH